MFMRALLRPRPFLAPFRTTTRALPLFLVRRYAILSHSKPGEGVAFQVFDRASKRRQRDRAASDVETSRTVDYLRDEVAARVADRLLVRGLSCVGGKGRSHGLIVSFCEPQDIKRGFDTIVDLGSGCGHIVKQLDSDIARRIVMCEMSVEVERRLVDEEFLPFEENSLEAVVSSLSLHWVNDLPGERTTGSMIGAVDISAAGPRAHANWHLSREPGALIQIQRALKPDGVFIGALLGGDTLFELRTSLQLAELERESGISPRVSPLTDTRDLGSLLSRAGFTLTTVDIDEVVVNYPSALELMQDLRAMGESNAVLSRRPFLKRDTLLAAAAIYKASSYNFRDANPSDVELHGNPDGSVPATFQILYMIGWKPSPLTPQPKERGSGTVSLKDMLTGGVGKEDGKA
ncbi:S-adenosyl-L-methionine-dependent methyltransferase [Jimgerdemannia flammicorona]|uniref:S-adenosyl-L-methionine-dependent methyltransferase n=1 Tax=Jimgerdemannia flammicorona TaxID=994334 RepID=A0A433CY54_9FUNG|nr:S-adenosyl-L-methionine-dependent methyltransferase [Jimgerdemannia flammicorona]